MSKMKKQYKEFIQRVMKSAYEQAGGAFSRMLDLPVEQGSILIGYEPGLTVQAYRGNTKNYLVLVTDIIGDARGQSFLFWPEDEAELVSMFLLKNLRDNPNTELKEAILKELDNVVTASAITTFSNLSNLKIYGDVPLLVRLSGKELQDWLLKEIKYPATQRPLVETMVRFSIQGLPVSPCFAWMLDEEFVEAFQKISEHESVKF